MGGVKQVGFVVMMRNPPMTLQDAHEKEASDVPHLGSYLRVDENSLVA